MTGVDLIISQLADKIGALPYIGKSYGRAMVFKEQWGAKGLYSVPKVHVGNGEYQICLPNDTYTAQSYFIAANGEHYNQFDRLNIGQINRQFAVVFWGALGMNGVPSDLETIKFQFIDILQKDSHVRNLDTYNDEKYELIFPEFQSWISRSTARDSEKTQADTNWLMYPNSGFRLTFTLAYTQPCL
jgi:hypothetical protein